MISNFIPTEKKCHVGGLGCMGSLPFIVVLVVVTEGKSGIWINRL